MRIRNMRYRSTSSYIPLRRAGHLGLLLCFLFSGCTGFFASKILDPIENSEVNQVSYQDVTLHYLEVGDKRNPPLIFLHGILAFTQAYSEFIEKLAERYYVIGIDLRGHGLSSIGSEPYSHQLVADDVMRVADEIGIDRFHVVGHSAGGFALLSIAKYYPDRMIKGVSIASLYDREGIDFNEKNDDYLTRQGFMDNRNGRNNYTLKIFDSAYEKMGEGEKFDSTKKIMQEYGASMFPSYSSDDLNEIKNPILVIVAERDTRIKPAHTMQMSELLQDSRLEMVSGAAHFGIVKRKKHMKIVADHIFNFLE
jgi:pimeloyl-ACP methyl ester carboxylesterase